MTKRSWVVVVVVVAVAGAGGWFVRDQASTASAPNHGEAFGKALVSGQLLRGHDPRHAEPLARGSVTLANIYQIGPPVGPTTDVWSDGGFSMYVEPGSYTVFGMSPEFHDGTKACQPYRVPNGTISIQPGDRISVALMCR